MVNVQTGNMLDVIVEGKSIGLKQRDSDHRKYDVIWLPKPEGLRDVLATEITRLSPPEKQTTTLTSDEREIIEIGDRVRVEFWQGKDDICGDVVYLPMQAGDSWIIRSEDRLFYVQHFAAISKRLTVGGRP